MNIVLHVGKLAASAAVLWSIAGALAMEFIGCASTLSSACNLFVANMFYLRSHWFIGVWSSQR
jgi:hypothetical protein